MTKISEIVQKHTELSKAKVQEYVSELIALNDEGKIDTLTALGRIEFLSQILDGAKEAFRIRAVEELDLYGPEAKSGVKKDGVTFKHKETAVKYDFTNCDYWNSLKEEEESISKNRKDFESLLKTLKTATEIADPLTGEMIRVVPPIKSSKTTVEITLSK
jgi:hypothetical protein